MPEQIEQNIENMDKDSKEMPRPEKQPIIIPKTKIIENPKGQDLKQGQKGIKQEELEEPKTREYIIKPTNQSNIIYAENKSIKQNKPIYRKTIEKKPIIQKNIINKSVMQNKNLKQNIVNKSIYTKTMGRKPIYKKNIGKQENLNNSSFDSKNYKEDNF